MSARFRLVAEGVEVTLPPHEVAFLSDLIKVLAGLGTPENDPGAARLSPPAYLGEPEANEDWKRFAGTELTAARRADRSAFELILEAVDKAREEGEGSAVISIPEAEAVLRVANDARLVLAARWGVDTAGDYERLRPEAGDILAFLGWLVSDLAVVLGGALDR